MKVGCILIAFFLAVVVSVAMPMALSQPSKAASPLIQIEDFSDLKTPPRGHPKVESRLWQLIDAAGQTQSEAFASRHAIDLVDGNVRVVIEAKPGWVEFVIEAINSKGGTVEATYQNMVQAVVLPSTIPSLADETNVRLIRLPRKPVLAVVSEGAEVIGATQWNDAGWTGTGVKVGIVDVGFAGYDALLGTELPPSVHTHWCTSIGGPGTYEHGTACAEIIHDIAPDAELYLANCLSEVDMGYAVDWLKAQGVDVISASVGHPLWGPGDGTGPACDVVDAARDAGILWCNAAGNFAESHWMGPWLDTDGDDAHEFEGGDETNEFWVPEGFPIQVFLQWDDPWGASDNDYDLALVHVDSGDWWLSYNDQADGYDYPYEWIEVIAPHTGEYHVVILRYDADGTAEFHLFNNYYVLEYSIAASSLVPPADSTNALTVGAVPWHTPDILEPFSSHGPTGDGRTKPDLVAPDGVSTSSWGQAGFSGTSASAPHVAGAVALVQEAFPDYGPDEIQAFLEEHAVDLGPAGKDNEYGSGRLFLPVICSIVLDTEPGIASLTVDGTSYSGEELPVELSWVEGSQHTCTAPSSVSSDQQGTRYVFTSWNDGGTSPSRTITATDDATYTANYKTQHHLTVESDYGQPSGEGWYDQGSAADISTEEIVGDQETRHVFLNWMVDGAEHEDDTDTSITIDSPHTAVADYNTQHYLKVTSNYGEPTGEDWYDEGTTAEIEIEDMITEGDTRHIFENWVVDGAERSGNLLSFEMYAPHQAEADYQTQYYLTVISEYGEPTGKGWYDKDSTATASVTSPVGTIVRKLFTRWSGDSTSSSVPVDVVMDEPKTLVANWRNDYLYVYVIVVGALVVLVGGSAMAIISRSGRGHRPPGGGPYLDQSYDRSLG